MSQQWYYSRQGQQVGPVASEELRKAVAGGQLLRTDLVWRQGLPSWLPAGNVNGLFPSANPLASVPATPNQQSVYPAIPVASAPSQAPLRVELAEASADANKTQWYYAIKGQRIGPIGDDGITQLLAQGTLNNDTLVWKSGLDNWIPIVQTGLRKATIEPPPLTGSAVNNGLIWTVAFVPIIGMWLQEFIGGLTNSSSASLWFVVPALNVVLCAVDDLVLKQAGHDTDAFGSWIWLVPVYLFKRAKALKQSLAYFITWIVCFFVSLL